ncbi:MAG: hypothetical protein GF392_05970 [Candidatus Omnitrophica bacterium]|nr:hypothetical protein [Candidatus Omnitrophota bacterium]
MRTAGSYFIRDKAIGFLTAAFFVTVLVTGLLAFDDHGISGDEIVNRNNGILAYGYITEADESLLSYRDRHYGTFFELPLFMLEKSMGLTDSRRIFLLRHLATFMMFFFGLIFFFLLIRRIFSNPVMPLLGSVFLFLSPRIFAHSFYNSKDIVFMSLYITAAYTLSRFLDKRDMLSGGWHALACAALMGVRIAGAVVPVLTAVLYAADRTLRASSGKERRSGHSGMLLFIGLTPILTVLVRPFLWGHPAARFTEVLRRMIQFPWNGTVLYLGRYVHAAELPWHYVPGWMALTTPLLYLLFFPPGLMVFPGDIGRNVKDTYGRLRSHIMVLSLFIVPLAGIILSGAVLYDGWRHMYFIYPMFLIISLRGIDKTFSAVSRIGRKRLRAALKGVMAVIICAALAVTASRMYRMHPYQNVYFNPIAGAGDELRERFELDYWGLGYREALEHIAGTDPAGSIPVHVSMFPGGLGRIPALILKEEERKRFVFTDAPSEATYFVTNYRWHREDYPYENEMYTVEADGVKIVSVFRLKE